MDVALHGGAVLEEVLCLPPVERVGGLERLLEVFWACASLAGLRSGGVVGRSHHLLPTRFRSLILLSWRRWDKAGSSPSSPPLR
jgi:hypothetical protein